MCSLQVEVCNMYDIIIIGSGPGGYVAAERAGARGKKVLLIEKSHFGGVCLNEGCIPTKTLLNAAKLFVHGKESGQFGVHFDNPVFNLGEAMAWKEKVIDTQRKGIAFLMKKYKVDVMNGSAEFVGKNTVKAGDSSYQAEHIIIATGSSAVIPPIPGATLPHVKTNREILSINELPKKLAVIGGGVIGMEFASFFSSVGVEVHVIEMMEEIIPNFDADIAAALRKAMKRISFHLGARVEAVEPAAVTFSVSGKTETVEADMVLMSTGRSPNVQGLGLEAIGLDFDRKGIRVNEKMQTNVPGVYAIGDVTGTSLLAHSASRMAEVAVNTICGDSDRMRYSAIPWVVYTLPEVAGCGLTEAACRKEGRKVKTAVAQMRINGRFLAENGMGASGYCKVIADEQSDAIVGVHMIGGGCSEIIYGAALMIEAELRVKDIKQIVFPHPTVGEIIKDTVWEIV